jgi:glycosyltransferase involved in cell wall biosynthesis
MSGPASAPIVFFLPAHDEAPVVGRVLARMPVAVRGHPVVPVVVDDGSTDGTASIAAAAGADVVTFPVNRGLGAAVRRGLALGAERGAVAVVFCDADLEYDPAELEVLVGPILEGEADYVVGSRFAGGPRRMRPHREVGNRVLTRVVRWTTRLPVTDGQSGYRALSAEAAAAAELIHDYNYAQVLTIDLAGKGFRYAEVPITYAFRETGRSFVRLGTYLRTVGPAVARQVVRSRRVARASAAGARTGGEDRAPVLDVEVERVGALHEVGEHVGEPLGLLGVGEVP